MKIIEFYKISVRDLINAGPKGAPVGGIKTAELDAKVLLKFVLENDETFLLMHPQMPLTNYQFTKLKKLLKKRLGGEPIAYLTSHKEFFGHDFSVTKNVLIPRPETENLVELGLNFLKSKDQSLKTKARILDLGTGSGCIIISLFLEMERLSTFDFRLSTEFYASDISKKSLTVAKKNYKRLVCHSEQGEESPKIKFYHSDFFSNRLLHKKYDIIIANLPYVPKETKDKRLKTEAERQSCHSEAKPKNPIDFEPSDAIFADDNGAAVIKKLLTEAKKYLNKNGLILLELDPRNAADIQKFTTKNYPNAQIELKKDLAELERYLMLRT